MTHSAIVTYTDFENPKPITVRWSIKANKKTSENAYIRKIKYITETIRCGKVISVTDYHIDKEGEFYEI